MVEKEVTENQEALNEESIEEMDVDEELFDGLAATAD